MPDSMLDDLDVQVNAILYINEACSAIRDRPWDI